MNEPITYRPAGLADLLKLSVLFKQVYIHTYAAEGVSDEFANFITRQFSEERLREAIVANPDTLWVAVYKENLVGVAETTFNKKCPLGDLVAPEINKLYILEHFCGKGVGKGLLQEVEQMLKAKGEKTIWLWVYLPNTRAINFYERQNYKWIGNAFFQMEKNRYENKVMVKEL